MSARPKVSLPVKTHVTQGHDQTVPFQRDRPIDHYKADSKSPKGEGGRKVE